MLEPSPVLFGFKRNLGTEARKNKTFVEGKHVCILYDLITNAPAKTVGNLAM